MVTPAPDTPPGAPRSPSEPALPIPPLIRHKVTPPPPEPRLLQRPRLLRALDEAAGQRLTLLAAPAGAGKTALLSAWANTQGARSAAATRLAWLSLGREENEPMVLATMLAAALQRAGLPLSWPPFPLCEDDERVRVTMAWSLNAIAAADEPVTLVLDGYDALTSPAAHELVLALLEQGSPGLRVIVAARGEPPLPLARLRARRQLAELRGEDLRWSVSEAAMYLNDRLGLALAHPQIAELVARTEGWVTGLSLAALALEERRAAPELAAQRFVADFMVGEVLEREPQPTQHFLLQTALLDELSGPLVESLLLPEDGSAERAALLGGFPSGLAALEALERRGLFLHPIEGRPGWYRYHGLFAETLREQLHQRLPERAAELTARLAGSTVGQGAPPRPARAEAPASEGLAEPLSEREQETLGLIAAGKPNREVAALLNISESTVKSHVKHIFAKLNARNRTEAVAIARDLQLLGP
jgi:LuxR family maltose regulon positive regulatory protein